MTEITRTSNTIIEKAYKLIGIFSSERALSKGDVNEGLNTLNALLDNYSSNNTKIAYDKQLTFPVTAGKQRYTFSTAIGADVDSQRIVNLKFINLEDANFLYPVDIVADVIYYRRAQALNATCRPVQAYFQNENEQSFIFFFTKPEIDYSCTIKAKFMIDKVSLNQPLAEVPGYYHDFLAYAVARNLQDVFDGSSWNDKKEAKYKELLKDVIGATDLDFNIKTGAMLKAGRGYNDGRIMRGY